VVGHDKETVYAKSLLRDGTMKDLYTTNEQILGAAYDGQRNLLTFSVGREAAKLVIIDIAHPNHSQWVPEAGIPPFYPPSVHSEIGLLAYSIDKRTHQKLEWSSPLADVSALFSTVTKDGPVWVANSLFQPPFL